jgi:DNA uptake protein ComE-like DNA-binding protein
MKLTKVRIPKKPDQHTLELLIRAKLLLSHALSHVDGTTAIDKMISILGLDNSIEYMLRILVSHLDIESITGKTLETAELASLAGEINSFLKERTARSLPYLNEIKLIRRTRNLVQHGMVDPQHELSRYVNITEHFFDELLTRMYGLNRFDLRISSLVQQEGIRKHLMLAEERLDSKKYLLSIVSSRDAFENALFARVGHSDLRFSLAPVLIEKKSQESREYWFLKSFVDEFEISKLGADMARYERYKEYLRHIPEEHWVDRSGWSPMQRPWKKEDALFCYEFVADTVLRWQAFEFPPLYKREDFHTSGSDAIAGIDLEGANRNGMMYGWGDGETMELMYCSRQLKKRLEELTVETEHTYISDVAWDENRRIYREEMVKLLGIDSRLITNSPERYMVIIWYKEVPFTCKFAKYENDNLVERPLCINSASTQELASIHEDVIPLELAAKIVSLRNAIGKISGADDLRKIPGITEEQISWLASRTHT